MLTASCSISTSLQRAHLPGSLQARACRPRRQTLPRSCHSTQSRAACEAEGWRQSPLCVRSATRENKPAQFLLRADELPSRFLLPAAGVCPCLSLFLRISPDLGAAPPS